MKNFNKVVKEKFNNFFDWVKGAKLVELPLITIKGLIGMGLMSGYHSYDNFYLLKNI